MDPANGRVGDYESTEGGAEIGVYCFDKLSENQLTLSMVLEIKCLNLISTTVVAPQECYVLGSLFHQYLNNYV